MAGLITLAEARGPKRMNVIFVQCASGTARLKQAVDAYTETLKECTREAAPYHDMAQRNLARAQALLDARRTGGGK